MCKTLDLDHLGINSQISSIIGTNVDVTRLAGISCKLRTYREAVVNHSPSAAPRLANIHAYMHAGGQSE